MMARNRITRQPSYDLAMDVIDFFRLNKAQAKGIQVQVIESV
jgi:hypothetical protein